MKDIQRAVVSECGVKLNEGTEQKKKVPSINLKKKKRYNSQ